MPLFHFSEEEGIRRFEPRPVRIPSPRTPGREWLNGPLVWAIDDWHQPMYLFPRDCPRILMWPVANTTEEDRRAWWGERSCRMIAHIERRWLARLGSARLYRHELPQSSFEDLGDAGMWVSRSPVEPLRTELIADLPAALGENQVELRAMESLAPLKPAWESSLHVSGIRLRNARGWAK
jgi:hypothetical protein